MPSTMSEPAPASRAETVPCAWCGAEAFPTDVALATCPACGAATTFPVPSPAELERAYARYRPSEGRFSAGGDRLLARSRGVLARRLDRIAPAGPVLDVGAGDGSLLRALRARGRETVGLERASGEDGVLDREIDDFNERPGEWAAVVFWHSLEHLPRPAAALDQAVALLAPGGVVAIAVPNLSSWQARCFGRRWLHLDLPRHLVHVPASALQAGVGERGLTLDRVSYWRGGQILFGWLHGMVAQLPGHPDLYSAIRRPSAQERRSAGLRRLTVLLAACAMAPAAVLLALAEIAAGAGGTVYVEARK